MYRIEIGCVVTNNDAVREHFKLMNDARRAYLEADCSARLKKALKSQVPSHNDLVFLSGEKVFFRDEHEQWDGPAEVVVQDGRTVHLNWQGNLRKAATSRLLKYFNDTEEANGEIDENEEVNNVEDKNNSENEGIICNCAKCNFQTKEILIIKEHISSNHELKEFNCEHCDFVSTKGDDLKEHNDNFHDVTKIVDVKENIEDIPDHTCEQCDFSSPNRDDINTHVERLHKNSQQDMNQQMTSLRKRKSTELRPSIRQNIKYKTFEDDNWKSGNVVRVGKPTGKDKHSCWIRDKQYNEHKINFANDVEDWKYIKRVKFSNDTEDTFDKNDDQISNTYFSELKLDKSGANELNHVFAT